MRSRPTSTPFDDRPDTVDCPTSAWAVEVAEDGGALLEIDTGVCDYLTLTQETQVDLVAGDALSLSWGHSDLVADAAAQAHLAVWLDEIVLVDTPVAIPADGDETRYEHSVETDVPAGSPVWLHLHNHGDNTWTLGELFRTGEVLR